MTSRLIIAIVGGGLMGHGIAQVFALAGHAVRVYDPVPEVLATLRERIRKNLSDLGQKVTAAALIRLAASASVEFDHITRPIMAELSQAVGETVDLSVLKGNAAVFTDQVQGRHRLRAVSAVGESFPLHCTANGKALLSVLPAEKLERLLRAPLPKLTANTITKPADLLKEIEICRRTGIAIDDEEHTEGISALGTGFLDPMGRAIALSIPVPTTRFKRIRQEIGTHLLTARERIRAALGEPTG